MTQLADAGRDSPDNQGPGEFLGYHDEALLEAGKAMLLDSLAVGREFCKFMVGTATGAVPIYLSLVKWFLPEQYDLSRNEQGLAVAPVFAFMFAAMFYVYGYMPTRGSFSVDLLAQIEKQRAESINRRRDAIVIGFIFFVIGVIGGSLVTIYLIPDVTIKPPPT
jgi:uncharacterized membrane protein YccC